MSSRFDIANWESQWVLGLLPIADIPAIAQKMLVEGASSATLLELAICTADESEQTERLFRRYLEENGMGAMSTRDALRQYAKDISASILAEKIPAYDGARLLWRATVHAGEKDFHELDPFIYAASEMEERPKDSDFFIKVIRDEATRWAAGT